MKSNFRFNNIHNFTTEQIKNRPFECMTGEHTLMFIGTLTHADKDYVYGEFLHNGKEDVLIDFGDIYSFEIKYES